MQKNGLIEELAMMQELNNHFQSEVKGLNDSHGKTSKELSKLFERLDQIEQHSPSSNKRKEEMSEKLGGMYSVDEALENEIAESKENQAQLLTHVNKLLECLGGVTTEKNELVEKLAIRCKG